eukprot:1092431-Prymnesium_polylepis.1
MKVPDAERRRSVGGGPSAARARSSASRIPARGGEAEVRRRAMGLGRADECAPYAAAPWWLGSLA